MQSGGDHGGGGGGEGGDFPSLNFDSGFESIFAVPPTPNTPQRYSGFQGRSTPRQSGSACSQCDAYKKVSRSVSKERSHKENWENRLK